MLFSVPMKIDVYYDDFASLFRAQSGMESYLQVQLNALFEYEIKLLATVNSEVISFKLS